MKTEMNISTHVSYKWHGNRIADRAYELNHIELNHIDLVHFLLSFKLTVTGNFNQFIYIMHDNLPAFCFENSKFFKFR